MRAGLIRVSGMGEDFVAVPAKVAFKSVDNLGKGLSLLPENGDSF